MFSSDCAFEGLSEQRQTDPDASLSHFCWKRATMKCFDRHFLTEAGTLPILHSAGLAHTGSSGLGWFLSVLAPSCVAV